MAGEINNLSHLLTHSLIHSQFRQYEWLTRDLAAANLNRSATPWIIMSVFFSQLSSHLNFPSVLLRFGHRSPYCSGAFASCGNDATIVRDGLLLPNGSRAF